MSDTSKVPPAPEHEKMEAILDQSQAIGEFLSWLQEEKKLHLAYYHTHGPTCDGWSEEEQKIIPKYKYECDKKHTHDAIFCERNRIFGCDLPQQELTSARYNTEELIANFFNIDLEKIEQEDRALLEHIRKSQESKCEP